MRETPVVIDGPVGQLEALYLDNEQPRGLALICHPNPVQGGTMLNKVVSTLQRTARDAGLITLRFNYRGVGASEGTHDMGTGEVDDAQAVAKWFRARHPDLPLNLFGFSFGGFVAASLGGRLEAQGDQTGVAGRALQGRDDLVEHGAALHRVRMADQRDAARLLVIQVKSFNLADWAINHYRGFTHQQGRNSVTSNRVDSSSKLSVPIYCE